MINIPGTEHTKTPRQFPTLDVTAATMAGKLTSAVSFPMLRLIYLIFR